MGKFVITTRTNGEYQFNLNAGNGQIILTSEGYSSKESCKNGVASVKKNAEDDSRYDRKKAKNGNSYFNVKAANGLIIGISQMYESEAALKTGIESVKKNAPDALVEDQTV